MKYMSGILIVFGVATALVAFNLDVTIDDSEVTNLNLMAQRQNLLMIGCFIFIAGIIVLVSSNKGSTANKEGAVIDKSGKIDIKTFRHKFDTSAKILVLSSLAILVSLCLSWEVTGVKAGGSFMPVASQYIGVARAFSVFLLWAYPIYTIIAVEKRCFKILIVNTTAALIWMGWNIFKFMDWSMHIEMETDLIVNAGKGMFLAIASVLLLIVGTFLARSSQGVRAPSVNAS